VDDGGFCSVLVEAARIKGRNVLRHGPSLLVVVI
jgi:hypothetical protein